MAPRHPGRAARGHGPPEFGRRAPRHPAARTHRAAGAQARRRQEAAEEAGPQPGPRRSAPPGAARPRARPGRLLRQRGRARRWVSGAGAGLGRAACGECGSRDAEGKGCAVGHSENKDLQRLRCTRAEGMIREAQTELCAVRSQGFMPIPGKTRVSYSCAVGRLVIDIM